MLLTKAAATIPYCGIKIMSPVKITIKAKTAAVMFILILFLPAKNAVSVKMPDRAKMPGISIKKG